MNFPAQSDLKNFADTGDEAAFGRVVEALGGLVFSSALQRTGDRGMAEEVAQNVFAILARKAGRLANHPSLEGWLFTTTRLESITAIRKRGRHQRRIDALTEAAAIETMTNEHTWTEALPQLQKGIDRLAENEREILLARFYSGNSFKEIAERFGKSEAACKMRVKRALEKLKGWLSGKGVKLSVAAIATSMSSEFTNAAVPANLATQALSAAPGIGAGAILTNTLITMNTLKQAGLIVISILALGSVPILLQHSQANQLQRQIENLQTQFVSPATPAQPALTQIETSDEQIRLESFTIDDPAEFASRLVRAEIRNDQLELTMINSGVAHLSDKEVERLIDDVHNADLRENAKSYAYLYFAELAHERKEIGEAVFDLMLEGIHATGNVGEALSQFASNKPAEALRWYQSGLDRGLIVASRGTRDTRRPMEIVKMLVDGFVESDPSAAITILGNLDTDAQVHVIGGIIRRSEHGRPLALDFIAAQPDMTARGEFMKPAVLFGTRRGLSREGAAQFVFDCDVSEQTRAATLISIPNDMSIAQTGDWLITKLGPGESGTIENFVDQSLKVNPEETQQWIDSLPPGDALDRIIRQREGASP